MDSLHPLPSPPFKNNNKFIKQIKPQETILRIFLKMKLYLPARPGRTVTAFPGRSARRCHALLSLQVTSSETRGVFHRCSHPGLPPGEQSARAAQQQAALTQDFIHFCRLGAGPVRVLGCIYVVQLKPTVISTMELRISEPTS